MEEEMLAEKKFYNAVAIATGGELATLHKIKKEYPDWYSAWRKIKAPKIDPEEEWGKLIATGTRLLWPDELPSELLEIAAPPLAIYMKGKLPKNEQRISVVGTRRATPQAKDLTRGLARELARSGVVIVSGLAMGIDTAAHEGALAGGGRTIAVLANSLDGIYPRQNANLAEKILEGGGALMSEYPFGSTTFPNRFLERNRIVAGLSAGTVVVEAPLESGSLVTANLALEANREVFVIPGLATHPNYAGSHKLIRSGARLAVSAGDILEDLNWVTEKDPQADQLSQSLLLSGVDQKIFEALKASVCAVGVDRIQELTQISVLDLNRHLTFLQIKGLVKEQDGRYYINN